MGLEEGFAKIQALVDAVDPNNRKVVHIFKLNFTENGTVVKTMMLDLVNVKFYEGDDDAECTLTLDEETLAAIFSKSVDAAELLNSGRLQCEGNLALIQKLAAALSEK